MSHDDFDRLMNPDVWGGGHEQARQAARAVADTLLLCSAWWQQYGRGVRPTAADLLKMCEMMMQRERELIREGG